MENKKLNEKSLLILLLLSMILLIGLSLTLGASSMPIQELFSNTPKANSILLHIRLPRILAALLCGGALAVAGGILQKVLANPLASPSVLGINSGAGLMAALSGAFFSGAWQIRQPAAFLGAFVSSLLMLGLIRKFRASKLTIVLAGLAMTQIFGAMIDLLVTFIPEALIAYSDFKIGTLAGITLQEIQWTAPFILIGILLALLASNHLEILSLGADQAKSLGLNTMKWTILMILLTSLLCGAAVSLCGLLGFIGLLVPHMVSHIKTSKLSHWLGLTCLSGGCLLLFADLLSRTIAIPYEIPTGILLSLIGAPYFLWLVFGSKWRKL